MQYMNDNHHCSLVSMTRKSSKCLPSTKRRALSPADAILATTVIGDGASLGDGLFSIEFGVSTMISFIGDTGDV